MRKSQPFIPIYSPIPRVYMSFMQRQGWHFQFLEEGLKTPLPKKLAFRGQEMDFELARRGAPSTTLKSSKRFIIGSTAAEADCCSI